VDSPPKAANQEGGGIEPSHPQKVEIQDLKLSRFFMIFIDFFKPNNIYTIGFGKISVEFVFPRFP
jgi:hypothetical protein